MNGWVERGPCLIPARFLLYDIHVSSIIHGLVVVMLLRPNIFKSSAHTRRFLPAARLRLPWLAPLISASPAPHLVFRFVNNTLTCISHSPSRVHCTPAGLSSARRLVQGHALPGYTLRKAISQTCQRSASTVDHPRRFTVCTVNIKMHNIFSKLKRATIRSIRSKETTKS